MDDKPNPSLDDINERLNRIQNQNKIEEEKE